MCALLVGIIVLVLGVFAIGVWRQNIDRKTLIEADGVVESVTGEQTDVNKEDITEVLDDEVAYAE